MDFKRIERPLCPFYGFDLRYGAMSDSRGRNQCALRSDRGNLYPCQMEIDELAPDWEKCGINTEDKRKELEGISDTTQVFPMEFYPKKGGEWEGMSLREWMAYIESKRFSKS